MDSCYLRDLLDTGTSGGGGGGGSGGGGSGGGGGGGGGGSGDTLGNVGGGAARNFEDDDPNYNCAPYNRDAIAGRADSSFASGMMYRTIAYLHVVLRSHHVPFPPSERQAV